MQAGPFMRLAEGGRYFHWCPECKMSHALPADNGWTFDGNLEAPTFSPSFRQMRVKDGKDCHYFIKGGMIVWCSDSYHGRSDSQPMVRLSDPDVDDGDGLDWL